MNLPSQPAAMAAGYGSLWLALPSRGEVLRLEPGSGTVSDRIPVQEPPGALAVGGGSVWVATVPGDAIARIDPKSGTVAQTVRLGSARVAALAYGAGAVWVADSTGNALLKVDPASGAVRRRLPVPLKPTSLVVGDPEIWVADYGGAVIAEIDGRSGRTLATVHVGNGPAGLAAAGDAVWVANALDSTVSKVARATVSLQATVPVGSGPTAIAERNGVVWVANAYSSTVTRIDARRARVVRTDHVAGAPTALGEAGDRMWVGVRPLVEHRGGTLRLLFTRPLKLDPALQTAVLPLQSDRLTRSGLLAFNHVSGPAGTQLVPDLAISVPTPTSGGTEYTFRLRPGIRYSDGRPVHAADFRRAVERALALGAGRGVGIVGASACAGAKAGGCDLSAGIVTDEAARTVMFRLRAPDPEFLDLVAFAAAGTPVPPGTPAHDVGFQPIPGTGPYKVASASEREVRFVRNPYFHERSHAAQPDGEPDAIVMRFGLSSEQQTREIEAGRADWAGDNVPSALLPGLRARFPERFHHWAVPASDFFQLNRTLAPFDDVRVRRAFNFAIDRREIVRLYGGPDFATPTCQVLPPGPAGYRRYCPYTRAPSGAGDWTGPDLVRARRLVAASGTRGARVTVWGWTDDSAISPKVVRYAASILRRLGYRTRVHLVPHDRIGASPGTIQLIASSWGGNANGLFATWFAVRRAVRSREVLRRAHRPAAAARPDVGVDEAAHLEGDLGCDRSSARRSGRIGPDGQRARARLHVRARAQLPIPPILGPDRRPAMARQTLALSLTLPQTIDFPARAGCGREQASLRAAASRRRSWSSSPRISRLRDRGPSALDRRGPDPRLGAAPPRGRAARTRGNQPWRTGGWRCGARRPR